MNKSYPAFFKVELKSLFREPMSLFFMFVLPIIFTMVFGGAYGDKPTQFGADVLAIDTVVPINIVFLLANAGLMGIPITVIELKDQEVLKRYITYPTQYRTYFASLISTFAFVSFLSTLLFGLMSFVLYGSKWRMNILDTLLFIAFYLLMLVIFDGIGFLIALFVKGSRVANMVTSGVFLSLIFTSGVVTPVKELPDYMQKIAYSLPMHHFIEIMQMLWVSRFNPSEMRWHILYIAVATIFIIFALWKARVKWD